MSLHSNFILKNNLTVKKNFKKHKSYRYCWEMSGTEFNLNLTAFFIRPDTVFLLLNIRPVGNRIIGSTGIIHSSGNLTGTWCRNAASSADLSWLIWLRSVVRPTSPMASSEKVNAWSCWLLRLPINLQAHQARNFSSGFHQCCGSITIFFRIRIPFSAEFWIRIKK
jgi:hypothetical protein